MLFTKKHTKQNHEDKSTVGIRNLNKVNRKGMLTVRNSAMNGYEFVFRILFENFKHSNRFKKNNTIDVTTSYFKILHTEIST